MTFEENTCVGIEKLICSVRRLKAGKIYLAKSAGVWEDEIEYQKLLIL